MVGDEFYDDEVTSGLDKPWMGPLPPVSPDVPLSMMRCSTCDALLDGIDSDCGNCGEIIE